MWSVILTIAVTLLTFRFVNGLIVHGVTAEAAATVAVGLLMAIARFTPRPWPPVTGVDATRPGVEGE